MPKNKKSRKKSKLSVLVGKTYKFLHGLYYRTLDVLEIELL
jgi:hypothetical protein